ncbi:Sterile alpha motif domain-containing protein 5 [Frankliniella fusca]|uniref:Sterile alpha motif domain-containing protein 5 n=1 Tax=Frankliniella fusca TaxID=407009 RepID=A0AAE1HQC8_9NEOP|nr:Sterile alpha motif domain-containing protein 5 [Frankliniella fusca]
MATSSNIVVEWLRSLHLGQYAESFLDNGYDDLEICKQVGDPDLDAIGVFNQAHRGRLLGSVRALREEGAASVYFSLEETAAAAAALNLAFHDDVESGHGSGVSSRNSSATGRPASESDREGNAGCGRPGPGPGPGSGPGSGSGSGPRGGHAGPQGHSPAPSSAGSNHELGKYLDEYEEGKAELVRLPRSLLRKLLREKLVQDGIRLCHQPYSTSQLTPIKAIKRKK